jgi:hypothetical protein
VSLRIAFDMDGVLADFAGAFRAIEARLFGPGVEDPVEAPDEAQVRQEHGLQATRARQDAVWKDIQATPDFWLGLSPIEPAAVRRLHEASLAHRWDVFFVTRRPATAGETVQRQTQRWLAAQGFELPSVLALHGPRGAVMRALRVHYLVDDSLENCLDTMADGGARTILVRPDAEPMAAHARKLGIAVVPGPLEAIDILEEATRAVTNPSLFQRLSAMVGWR